MAKLHAGLLTHGVAMHAVSQVAGKGRRGRSWQARPGENITMSLCLRPLHPQFPFLLSAAVALGCYDFIKESVRKNVSLKWPNDAYVDDRKAAGILIENVFRAQAWVASVAGIGVNVNQTDFGELSERATSLSLATNAQHDVLRSARRLQESVLARWTWAAGETTSAIMTAYNAVLYRRGKPVKLRKDGAVFETVIDRVSETGELYTHDTLPRVFSVSEVEFV